MNYVLAPIRFISLLLLFLVYAVIFVPYTIFGALALITAHSLLPIEVYLRVGDKIYSRFFTGPANLQAMD
jgi:hypothetical protein